MINRTYIAGPITGREYKEYRRHFAEAHVKLAREGRNPVSPVGLGELFPDFTHSEIMKVCIAVLECCREIYMLQGWENSIGAMMELDRAIDLGMRVSYEATATNARKE